MLKAEEIVKKAGQRPRRRVRIIGLGNAGFWAFIGFISGYLAAAVVACQVWYR